MVFSLAAIFLLIGVSAILLGTIQLGMTKRLPTPVPGGRIAGVAVWGAIVGAIVGSVLGLTQVSRRVAVPAGGGIGGLTGAVAAVGLLVPGAVMVIGVGSVLLLTAGAIVRAVAYRNRPEE